MKNLRITLLIAVVIIAAQIASAQSSQRIFDHVLFYDGYADTSILPQPGPEGVIRLSTSLYTTKLKQEQIDKLGSTLNLRVVIKAACDNYDRIGNVFLAFTPKGAATYDPSTTKRQEIARFITPFMNKNNMPDTVPYTFNIDNIASLLKDTQLTDTCDIWLEIGVFGVPYAANNEVAGCSGRSDVFYATVDFLSNTTLPANSENYFYPLANYINFNDYNANATDTLGKTTKTITFSVEDTSFNTKLYIITSNHGANQGGEEYIRRNHYINFDGSQVLMYKPGETTCEPYRKYNTQANGIYGPSPRSNAEWQSFSNWCPGAAIPIRSVNLGTVLPGEHKFMIRVPQAVFQGNDGNFPLTVYIQGKKVEQSTGIGENQIKLENSLLVPNPGSGIVSVQSEIEVRNVTVVTTLGHEVMKSEKSSFNTNTLADGVYFIHIRSNNGESTIKRFIKQ